MDLIEQATEKYMLSNPTSGYNGWRGRGPKSCTRKLTKIKKERRQWYIE